MRAREVVRHLRKITRTQFLRECREGNIKGEPGDGSCCLIAEYIKNKNKRVKDIDVGLDGIKINKKIFDGPEWQLDLVNDFDMHSIPKKYYRV